MEVPRWMESDLVPSNESMFGIVTWLFKTLRKDPSVTSQKAITFLESTYLNDAWLADKVITPRVVDFKDSARCMTDKGRMTGDWVDLLKLTGTEALADTRKHMPVIKSQIQAFKRQQAILATASPLRTAEDVNKQLFMLQQPFNKLRLTYMKSPFVLTVGSCKADNHIHRKGLDTMFVDPDTTQVTTLTKEQIKPVATELLTLIRMHQIIFKSYRSCGMQLVVTSLKSMGDQVRMPARDQEAITKMMRIQSDTPMIITALEYIIRAFTRLLTETVK